MVAKPLANRGCYKLSVLRLSLAFKDRPAPVIGQLYCSYIAVGYTELDNKFQLKKIHVEIFDRARIQCKSCRYSVNHVVIQYFVSKFS